MSKERNLWGDSKRLVLLSVVLFFCGVVFCQQDINVSAEISNLRSKDVAKKFSAIEKLAKSKDKRAINELKKALKTQKNKFVRTKIVESFSYFQDTDTAKELVNMAKAETDPAVKHAAVYSLGYNKDVSAVPVLIDIFLNEKEDLGVRLQAANSLTYYPPNEDIYQCFVKATKDKNPKIKAQALTSLSLSFGTKKEVVDMLKQSLKDEDEIVKKTAKERLEFLGVKAE
jgi:HEAT repeat protein